ncbi:D-inositol-3-phosphate glycosyltransferase [uncultured archaeon]|nr:D-inositol-3-phosphate glycosyltransferase [uncultured archaeon]
MKVTSQDQKHPGRKLKVLHVTNHFYPCIGGIETYILNLSKGLIKQGHTSDVLCLNTCSKSREKLPASGNYCGINIYRVPYTDFKYYKVTGMIGKYLKSYDIIHIHGLGFFADYLSITKMLHKKPMILSTYGGMFHTQRLISLKKAYFFGWCRVVARSFSKIIAISPEDEKVARQLSGNVQLVEAGIDYERFSSAKKKLDKNLLLYVGRISRNKRVDNLIRTVSYLKKDLKDIKLYIIGEDWENLKTGLQKLAVERDVEKNIVFTGKVSDEKLLEYLSRANFFVSASEYESFGLSVVESMAAGCIPILNDIGIFRNLIADGKEGFIVDFNNPESAAKKISAIFGKNIEPIRKRSRLFSKKYSWDKKVLLVEKIYNDSIGI